MKKHLMSMFALVLGIGMAQAKPVSVSQAKYVGQQFVQANFDQARQDSEITLVYTGTSSRNETCFYVFNVGTTGFVIVSADDFYRPIVAYSKEGCFDAQNINPEFAFMLNKVIEGREGRLTGQATPKVTAEWQTVMNTGRLISRNGGRGAFYLCETKWNQDYPYNYYCPSGPGGPGGRVYAGCVATAMSQMMKYWNHPQQGTGSHTNPNGGSANFGNTYYDWGNMPNSINSNSPQEQIDAVATLMYHCAVAVDMQWSVNGSGAYSQDVPQRISQYFGYTNQATLQSRDSYTYVNWMAMLKESLDMGWPVYYSGQSYAEGHAFICDGYDDNDLFHFNWGRGGNDDNYFDFDQIDYNSYDRAIFNFVPTGVYNATAQAPTNFTVTPAPNYGLAATVSWTNPSKTLNDSNLTSIDQIVVCRDNEIIYTQNNVSPGAQMSIIDNSVPRFDSFDYTVYAVCSGSHGRIAYQKKVGFGPVCTWNVNITQASNQGFRGGAIHIYNAAGTEIGQVTTTNSNIQSIPVDMPLGMVSFGWSAPTQTGAFDMTFTIKDSQNNSVYTYSGSSTNMTEGIFFSANNGCGSQAGTGVPSNLVALVDTGNNRNINVSWDGINNSGYGYLVYRDYMLYRLIPNATFFVDENAAIGGHCYYVGYLYDGGENGNYTNESCATSGECYAPRNLDYEYTGNNNKIKLLWERPEPSDGLSGYYIFRKTDDTEYTRIKLLGANATSYTDNSANVDGTWYYYKLYAYYGDLDCESAPANWIHDENQFYLPVYYSNTGVNYTITATASPSNAGTITGAGSYASGSTCTLRATPNSGYTFVNWLENGTSVSINATYSFTVTGNRNLVAVFDVAPTNYTITATANPSNGGSVTGGGTYASGSTCTLRATPNSSYTFVNWTKNGTQVSTNATYSFTVTGNGSYVANFEPIPVEYAITVNADPANGGTVSGGGTYAEGSTCVISAMPNEGYVFENWTRNGTVVSTEPTYSIVVIRNLTFVAHFAQNANQATITATAEPVEGGSVSGGGTYELGSNCTLNAVAAVGYEFVNWTLNGSQVSTDASFSFTVTGNAVYVAHFSEIVNHYTVSANVQPANAGSVIGAGTYEEGASCTLIAIANPTYTFVSWTENGAVVSTDEQYTFTVERDRDLVAVFSQGLFYTITATAGPNGTITPEGEIIVEPGKDKTFAIIPNSGCRVSKVLVDGVDVGPVESYTFRSVNANHSIRAQFSGLGVDDNPMHELKVYPNPANEMLNIKGNDIKRIAVYDILGTLHYEKETKESNPSISLVGFTQGTYLLKVEFTDGSHGWSRFVIAR